MRYIKLYAVTVTAVVLAVLSSGCTVPERMECNFGAADITPGENVVLAGFAARKGLSTTVHRPLKTRCLVIQEGPQRVCIISNDLMEIPIYLAGELRGEISERTGIPLSNIFIHCTHTHSAPRVSGSSVAEGGTNHAYLRKVRETIVDNAVRTAGDAKGFVPFSIEAGMGVCMMNCNRGEADGPCDHSVFAARLVDGGGNPVVSLLNFACHPVSLNHRSLVVSTDFPGITVDEVAREWGGEVMYFSGASGNVNPCGPLRSDTAYTRSRGLELADAVKAIEFGKYGDGKGLYVEDMEVRLPFRVSGVTAEAVDAHVAEISKWNVSGTWKADVEGWHAATLEKIAAGEVKDYLPFGIAAVNAGGLVLLFSQGEPFNEYQAILRESFQGVPILFAAYTNGQNSYLPSEHAYRSDAYEYEKEQMHIYIKAPYPLSDAMPEVYGSAVKAVVGDVLAAAK